MTQADALSKLKLRTAWESTPALTEDDLADCLDQSRLPDADGLPTIDAAWGAPETVTVDVDGTPTPVTTTPRGAYDLNLAAQLAWERKMGLAASCVDFTSDGERWDRSQIMRMCKDMADTYRAKRSGSLGPRDAQGRSLALLPFQIANGPEGD